GSFATAPSICICPEGAPRDGIAIQDFAAGPALVSRYNSAVSGQVQRAEQVLEAALSGDKIACQVVESAGAIAGAAIALLVDVHDPEVVVIGGGLGLAGGLYWESLVQSLRSHIWADTNRDLPVVPAALGANAGVIGAAAAFWQRTV